MALTPWAELTKEEKEKILAEGAAKRIAKTHALGLPTTHGDIHGAYRIYPDGRKVYLTEEEIKAYEEKCKNPDTVKRQ